MMQKFVQVAMFLNTAVAYFSIEQKGVCKYILVLIIAIW
jgi:hypothetical protein